MTEQPKTIQGHRGIKPPPEDRTKPYSAESYSAQYGITVEDAKELRETHPTHPEIERAIFSMYRRDPGLRDRAIFRGAGDPSLSEKQRKSFERSGVDVEAVAERVGSL